MARGTTWLTADTHFGHDAIRKYSNRPFKDLEDMNTKLIKNWNARVKSKDTVIFLGDFCFRKSSGLYTSLLNGNIVFIKGNHDKNTKINGLELELGGHLIWCCHRPVDIKPGYKLYFVAHVHQNWKFRKVRDYKINGYMVNVGVDVWNYMPVNIHEILKELEIWKDGKHKGVNRKILLSEDKGTG